VTIDGVDAFGFGSTASEGVIRIDKFARAVLGGELVCAVPSRGIGMLNSRVTIVGLGLLLP